MRKRALVIAGAAVALVTIGMVGAEVVEHVTAPSPSTAPGYVKGLLRAPGGPFIVDPQGRPVILHGVNAVYKHPPFVLYPDRGKPWNLGARDARQMQALGINLVRLGILWQGLEPGTSGPNNPAICTRGQPGNPGQFNRAVAMAYLAKVARTVNLLGRFHIYTLLDMHQDVYSQVFRGEGAPSWAVCTDGKPLVAFPGRWSRNYRNPSLIAAEQNFWTNDVVGNLQGQFDMVWGVVAGYFRNNPWIAGYDPINEPYSSVLRRSLRARRYPDNVAIDEECMYTGTARRGVTTSGERTPCPPGDPQMGLIPTIRAADPNHAIFREPDIFAAQGLLSTIGPMPFRNLVSNFHVYCRFRNPVTGNPTKLAACVAEERRTIDRRVAEAPSLSRRWTEPRGLPLFMSEFGATRNSNMLERVTSLANLHLFGWAYWAWKYYDDPTGSSAEAMVAPDGRLLAPALALSQTYPQAVAGVPTAITYDPSTAAFTLQYMTRRRIRGITLIAVPVRYHYPQGYCASVTGGDVVSLPNASILKVANTGAPVVTVHVASGSCP